MLVPPLSYKPRINRWSIKHFFFLINWCDACVLVVEWTSVMKYLHGMRSIARKTSTGALSSALTSAHWGSCQCHSAGCRPRTSAAAHTLCTPGGRPARQESGPMPQPPWEKDRVDCSTISHSGDSHIYSWLPHTMSTFKTQILGCHW